LGVFKGGGRRRVDKRTDGAGPRTHAPHLSTATIYSPKRLSPP